MQSSAGLVAEADGFAVVVVVVVTVVVDDDVDCISSILIDVLVIPLKLMMMLLWSCS